MDAIGIANNIPITYNPLADQAIILLNIKTSRPGTSCKLSPEERLRVLQPGEDKAVLKLDKVLFASPAYDAIKRSDKQFTDDTIARLALPATRLLRVGIYRVPLSLAERIQTACEVQASNRRNLVDDFMADYGAAIERASLELDDSLFNPANYKSQSAMRRCFSFTWQFFALAAPAALPRDLAQSQGDALKQLSEETIQECRDALRTSFFELVQRASERLRVSIDGKKAVFRDSLVDGMKDFLETFTDRNSLCDDAKLARLVEQARTVCNGSFTGEILRSDLAAREKIQATMQSLTNYMINEGMDPVTGREIDLSD